MVEVTAMHILILASTPDAAKTIQAAVGETADHYTFAVDWRDAQTCLEQDQPHLVLVERAALTRVEPAALLTLMEPSRWPPLIFVDAQADGTRDGVGLARRLARVSYPLYQVGELRIDTRKKRAGLGKRWVTLPPLQYRLLLTLVRRAGEVVSHEDLIQAVWGYERDDSEARELLKVHIHQIRRRLRLDPHERPYIRSVRGFGYMLAPPEEE